MWSRSARVAGGVCVGAARAAERQRENLTTVAVMADKRAGAGRSGRGGAGHCTVHCVVCVCVRVASEGVLW